MWFGFWVCGLQLEFGLGLGVSIAGRVCGWGLVVRVGGQVWGLGLLQKKFTRVKL